MPTIIDLASSILDAASRVADVVGSRVILSEADNTHDPATVSCEQAGPALWHPPDPKWNTVDRPGVTSLIEYAGQGPYVLELPIRLDGYPRTSIEPQIRDLEGFAEVQPGRSEPAAITVGGALPMPHPSIKWRLTAIEVPTEQLFLPGGKQRCRYVTTLTLTQHGEGGNIEDVLSGRKNSKGIKTRTTTARSGETDLFAVARRYYQDSSRASDIARANSRNLGDVLKPGTVLRMPS